MALFAAGFGAAAVAGAGLWFTTDRSTEVVSEALVNPPAPIDASNSPTLARNPRRPESLVVAYRADRPRFSASLGWSDDGGASWEQTPLPLPAGQDRPYAPDVAFAPDGTLYALYVNLQGPGNVPANLWLATSTNGGRSLSPPVRVAGPLTFQPRLAVDRAGAIHMTWLQAADVGVLRLSGSPNVIVTSRSTDGGRTFSPPVQVSDPERPRVGAASPVVDSSGRVVVLYEDFKADRRDFENLEGPPWDEPFALVLTRSDDGGKSFSPGVELESVLVPTRRFLVFLPDFPSLAAGPDGALYVAWADGRNGDEDVFLRRSTDGGRSWNDPVRVNDNPLRDGTTQYLPRVDVAPDGRVEVVLLDRRNDPRNVMTDAFLAFSRDGGRSFENVRVSSKSFDSRVGPSVGPPFGVDFGSRLGLASGDGGSVAAWADTRLGTEATGRQDVMAAGVDPGEEPRGIARLPVVAGLLALALLAMVAWWATVRVPRDG